MTNMRYAFIGLCEVKNSLKMAKHFFFTIHPVKAPDKRVACACATLVETVDNVEVVEVVGVVDVRKVSQVGKSGR